MIGILALHLLIAGVMPMLGGRFGRKSLLFGALAPGAAFIYAVVVAPEVMAGSPPISEHSWVPGLGLSIRFALDGFALVMVGVVSFVGVLVLVYARGYMADDRSAGRLGAYLVAFAGSMLGLVTANHLLIIFVFWELTSITSYMLIGLEDHRAEARSAALQALLVTGLGGLTMLGGMVIIGQAAGTTSLSAIVANPPQGMAVSVGVGLVLVGAFTKSAQVPFHFWLPGAMAAPTPVSAYLHSATMVKAGVFLIARLAPAFAITVGFWRPVVIGVGLLTMLLGGYRAFRQTDMKLLLAYGTVSQLGFMVALFGAGVVRLAVAGTVLLIAHTLFKAALFLITGVVDHQFHTRDIRKLHHVARKTPRLAAAAVVAAGSMAGVPLLFGFVAKEEALAAALDPATGTAMVAIVGLVAGSALTVAYSIRYVMGAFFTAANEEPELSDPTPGGFAMAAPVAVLTFLTLVFGLFPGLLDGLVTAADDSLYPGLEHLHLAVWHGFNPALGLSMVALLTGWLLWRLPGAWDQVGSVTGRLPAASHVYTRSVAGLNWLADRVTGALQSGSLPIYIGVILLTTIGLAAPNLGQAWTVPPDLVWALNPMQAGVVVLVILGAIGTARMEDRLYAVLWLGTVGYGVAVLMVIQGAPDVALTQMLVETMLVVIFVLVLRHLPRRFDRMPWKARQTTRVAIATGVGLFASLAAFLAAAQRPLRDISDEMVRLAVPEGGGANVVNVILTDFRALDTLGEITVVAVAAMGVIALVRAGMPENRDGSVELEGDSQ
ncbi:MAG: hydrogen gas-evolving membrane-bound hydrogenase subunit E [Acidimicrobiia bacterium]